MTPRAARARLAVPAAVLGFWVCATSAAALEPGYQWSQDYLSALASPGASARWLGVLMFVCGSLALGATSVVVRGLVQASRAPSAAMAVAGGCVLVAGVLPDASRPHSWAVVGYLVSFTVALLLLARGARTSGRRGLAGLTLAAAVLTPVLSVVTVLPDPGAAQRLWVVSGHLVLLALAAWPPRYGPRHG